MKRMIDDKLLSEKNGKLTAHEGIYDEAGNPIGSSDDVEIIELEAGSYGLDDLIDVIKKVQSGKAIVYNINAGHLNQVSFEGLLVAFDNAFEAEGIVSYPLIYSAEYNNSKEQIILIGYLQVGNVDFVQRTVTLEFGQV